MRVLVTGAAGFIGYHLCKKLRELGHEVIGIDNFNDYYSTKLKFDRSRILQNIGVQVDTVDICDLEALESIIEKHRTTHIVHLAAQAGVRYSLINPHTYLRTNLEGFGNILELCRKFSQLKLVFASSSSVYGLNTKTPFSIGDPVERQASLYGVTKRSNELMAHSYHHLYGIDLTGLRFFTVYGPWGRPDMAYYSFTQSILKNRPIKVFNYGKMKRDFTYIDDIIDGVIASMNTVKGFNLYNLGNNQPEPLLDLISTLEELLGKEAIKEMLPMQPGDVVATYADIDLSQKDLGYTPKVSLREGLARWVEWYQEYHSPSGQKALASP